MPVEPNGYALVTGASSGIGAAIAREYAARGRALILTARREGRLTELAGELRSQVPVVVIAADLADPAAPERLFEVCREQGLFVEILVNNAGYGVPGRYTSASWQTHGDFLQVMVTAVAELTHRFLPAMQTAGRGQILNVASVAGLVPGSIGHTLYGPVKSWLIKFSESLALEGDAHGVKACALCPGFTYSEFHDVTGTRGQVSQMPAYMWLKAPDVARAGIDAVERGEPICVPGAVYRIIHLLVKLLPGGLARRLVARRSKNFRDDS